MDVAAIVNAIITRNIAKLEVPAVQTLMSTNKTPESTSGRESQDDPTVEVCDRCFGTGVEVVPGKGARPCECQRLTYRKRLLAAARIPTRYSNCTFATYDHQSSGSLKSARMWAESMVEDYPAVEQGLLLMGRAGIGKTHLAVAVLRGLLEKGVPCLFCEFGALLKQIQDSYNQISKTSELRVLAPVYQAEVLVLDELGASVPTDWVRDTMYQIINKRYNDRKLTIFTTNYLDAPQVKGAEPAAAPSFGSKGSERIRELTTLEERIGTRLRSRLYEMCIQVVINGEDYRKRATRRGP
jgi:DNA replication protein DnaC